jgi:hypothetical protein
VSKEIQISLMVPDTYDETANSENLEDVEEYAQEYFDANYRDPDNELHQLEVMGDYLRIAIAQAHGLGALPAHRYKRLDPLIAAVLRVLAERP